jgi:hypothetical protein
MNYFVSASGRASTGTMPWKPCIPFTRTDAKGDPLDGSKHDYTRTFSAGQFPPVNAFWSVTMYDGKSQLLTFDADARRQNLEAPGCRRVEIARFGLERCVSDTSKVRICITRDGPWRAPIGSRPFISIS